MNQVGILLSIQVGTPHGYGTPRATATLERRWRTSFFRTPSTQPRWLYTTHLEGNEQADKKHHGSLSQAVLMYAAAHYPHWQQELQRPEIGPGGFGENFTVSNLSEETVCIGDVYAIGEARLQVTGPRYPCWKIERRWQFEGLTARVAATGRTGWYCSTQREGMIEPGAPIILRERPYPRWTMALINDFTHGRNKDRETMLALFECPILDAFWKQVIRKQVMAKVQAGLHS